MEEEQRDDLTALAQLLRTIKWKDLDGGSNSTQATGLDYLKSLMTFGHSIFSFPDMSHVPDQPARRRRRCCPFFLSGSRSLLCLHNDNPPSHNFELGIWTWGSRRSMNMRMSLSDRSEYAKRFLMETRLCYADNHAPATTRCLIMQTSNRANTSPFRRISASSSYPSSPRIKPALYSPSLLLSVYHHREGDLMESSGSRPPVPYQNGIRIRLRFSKQHESRRSLVLTSCLTHEAVLSYQTER